MALVDDDPAALSSVGYVRRGGALTSRHGGEGGVEVCGTRRSTRP